MAQLSHQACTIIDAADLVEIARRTFVEAFWDTNAPQSMNGYMEGAFQIPVFEAELREAGSHFFWALADGKRAGYLKLNESIAQKDVRDPASMEIERIYILSAYQGIGLGSYLLQLAENIAAEKGLEFLWLGVWEHNDKAMAFYQHHGFRRFGSHPFVMGEEVQTDLLMRKELLS